MPEEICPNCNTKHYYRNITGKDIKEKCINCGKELIVKYVTTKTMFLEEAICKKCGKQILIGMVPQKTYLSWRAESHGTTWKGGRTPGYKEEELCKECLAKSKKRGDSVMAEKKVKVEIPKEVVDKIVKLKKEGKTPKEIGVSVTMDAKKVRRVLRTNGLGANKKKTSPKSLSGLTPSTLETEREADEKAIVNNADNEKVSEEIFKEMDEGKIKEVVQ